MPKRAGAAFSPVIAVRRDSTVPLYKQVYDSIRSAILRGTLKRGLRLPSTRSLASELDVSRNIVVLAFEQLLAEGYIESRTGDGTYVTETLPDDVLEVRPVAMRRQISARGTTFRKLGVDSPAVSPAVRSAPFRVGLPALDQLPLDVWGRLLSRTCKGAPEEICGRGGAAGLHRLREAIATYVGVARGVRCEPDQVIIVNGSQQAIDLSARVLADPGDHAIIEDPGYIGARSALIAAGITLIPAPVEEDGLTCAVFSKKNVRPRLAYVTPSHQFPVGVVLSLFKRLHLLDWAARNDAWILEDDFDSEYRYESKPISALQGLDQNGRVIYMGTFSKVLFPSLRIGYVIVPPDLVDPFIAARWISDRTSPLIEQSALADFITEGHLATHIRRMRALYMERRTVMTEVIRKEMSDILDVSDSEAGLHMVGWLPAGVHDELISKAALQAGLCVLPLSALALRPLARGGLLLGHAAFRPEVIRKGIRTLGTVIRKTLRSGSARS